MGNDQAFWDNLFDKFDDHTKQDIADQAQALAKHTPEPSQANPSLSREDQLAVATQGLDPGTVSPGRETPLSDLGDLPLVNTPGHTIDR